MNVAPPGRDILAAAQATEATRSWVTWSVRLSSLVTGLTASGTTAQRPTTLLFIGRTYFDTTLGTPIWYDGTEWVDATGASA